MMIIDYHIMNLIFGKKIIDKMKVVILGNKGMLGSYTEKYLSDKYKVISLNRDNGFDAGKMKNKTLEVLFNQYEIKSNDVVINCIGTIKPVIDSLGDLNAILVNSVFPRMLANYCEVNNINLIHVTTDCVYTGKEGSYSEEYVKDDVSVYGMTKNLGEPNNCTIIRTSIIGEEKNNKRSLVEWIKSNKDKTVNGFTDHMWNGITCLEFAKVCDKIIQKNDFWKGIKHIHSPNSVTKKELVELISDVFELNITVQPVESGNYCNRTLSSIFNKSNEYNIPDLRNQVIEMKNYNISQNGKD